jgi:DNA repair exonuclease SbcCD ATPase subunit
VSSSSSVDSDWERRAKELNEKLRKFHDEKKELHEQHVEETEKVKNELHQRIEQEKQKAEEIAKKAHEDLQKEAQKHEVLTREGEEWRSRAVVLGEKVRELESNLTQKASTVEHLVRQKDDLVLQTEKAAAETQKELSVLRSREAEAQKELSAFRNRDQELSRTIAGLERNVHEMTESLRSRDSMLAQFEKQIQDLVEKAQGFESIRQEHAVLAKERATIRQEYDAKFAEQEVRLARDAEDQRRYRSRTDRKNAAATRELGEWIRGIDTIRQGLQKLILFLGSEAAVLDSEKKSGLRSPLTRGPDSPNTDKS